MASSTKSDTLSDTKKSSDPNVTLQAVHTSSDGHHNDDHIQEKSSLDASDHDEEDDTEYPTSWKVCFSENPLAFVGSKD